jgi:phosphoribosyl 1,2-cyclic phosphate phosphodiesterase
MRVILLGTGGSPGVPVIGGPDGRGNWGACDPHEPRNRRTRTSIIVEADDGRRLLVDTGPDLRSQLLAAGIGSVDAILYTHAHADHITGLDDVRILNRNAGRPLVAYGLAETLDELRDRFPYAFKPQTTLNFFCPELIARTVVAGEVVTTAGLWLHLFEQDHGWIKSLGFRCGGFAYSTDVVRLDDAAFAALEGVDTWVVGCVIRNGPHPTHAHLDLVLEWVARIRPRRTVMTHMGTEMDFGWLRANLPDGVEPGFDGMVLELQRQPERLAQTDVLWR